MLHKITKISAMFAMCSLAINALAAPITIEKQGSFAVGGSVKTSEGIYTPVPKQIADKQSNSFWEVYNASIQAGGQTRHGDHASVFYQIPVNAMASFGSGAAAPADAPNSLGADAALLAAGAVNDPNKLVS